MKKFAGLALGAAALLAPSTAHATDGTMCAPTSVHLCVAAKFTLTGSNTLNVFLFNGPTVGSSGWQSIITGFGVYNLGSLGGSWSLAGVSFNDWNGASTANGTISGWSFETAGGLNSLGVALNAGAAGGGSSGISTCDGPTSNGGNTRWQTCEGGATFSANADWLEFSFTHTSGTALDTGGGLALLQWGFKGQAVEGISGNSFECTSGIGSKKVCTSDGTGSNTEIDVVPEPATMSLLAMGLAGMAAASRRRRKK